MSRDLVFGAMFGVIAVVWVFFLVWLGGNIALHDATIKCDDLGAFIYSEVTCECRRASQ